MFARRNTNLSFAKARDVARDTLLPALPDAAVSRRICKSAELAAIKLTQTSLMQQIQERHSEGRPRLAILDDQLDELEAAREKLVLELAGTDAPAEDFQEKIARLKAQFDPA